MKNFLTFFIMFTIGFAVAETPDGYSCDFFATQSAPCNYAKLPEKEDFEPRILRIARIKDKRN